MERAQTCIFYPNSATLASLVSTSRSYLRAALIDFDNVLKTRPSLSRKTVLSGVARGASDIHIRQYVYGSRRMFYQLGGFRGLHSSVQLKPSASVEQKVPLGNVAREDAGPKNRLLTAAEDPWLQPDEDDGEHSTSDWISSTGPTSSLRFDWRERSLCRKIILSTPDNRKRYPRRKIFVMEPVQHGEPYFDAIQNYQKQCAFTTSPSFP
jgi:hypothetical protein